MASESGARVPRLNPFAFPSDTDFRFVLLIVMVLGASMFVYNSLYMNVPENAKRYADSSLECIKISPELKDDLWDWRKDPSDFIAKTSLFSRCMAEAERPLVIWMMSGPALVLGLAGVIYWMWPVLKIKRERLLPFSAADSPELVEYINKLCDEAGLSSHPEIMLDISNRGTGGVTFGRTGQYYIALPVGLVMLFSTDKPAFRAIMMHELGHIRNADISKTYFTLSIWYAFVIADLIPYAVTLIEQQISWIINIGWRVLVLGISVYLTRNAVLRSREIYADVQASRWEGTSGVLERLLDRLPSLKGSRWRALLAVHPDPADRKRAINDTHHLFNVGFWDAFGTGLASGIIFSSVSFFMNKLWLSGEYYLSWIISGLIVASLIVGVVGLGVWRSTFAALARGEMPGGAGRLGLGLGLGIIFGKFISFESSTLPYQKADLSRWIAYLGYNIIMGTFLIIILILFLKWIMTGASTWLEIAAGSHSPRSYYLLGLSIACGILTIFFSQYFSNSSIFTNPLQGGISSSVDQSSALFLDILMNITTLLVFPQFLIFLMLITLWAFPLSAWFYRKRLALDSGSKWAFLDETSRQLSLPRQPPFRIDLGLKIGLKSGLLFCIFLLVMRILWRFGIPEMTRNTDEYKLILYFLVNLMPAVLMQAGVAAFVAGRVERLSELHGLFAAFVSGCVMIVGILVLNLVFGGDIDAGFIWMVSSHVINLGTLLAMILLGIFAMFRYIRSSIRAGS